MRRHGAASGGTQARECGTPVASLAQPPIHVRATSAPSPAGALDVVTSCIASYLGVKVTVGGGAPGRQPYRLARDGAQRRVAGRSGSMTALKLDAVRLQLAAREATSLSGRCPSHCRHRSFTGWCAPLCCRPAARRPQCADFASQSFTPGCSPTARNRRRSFGQWSSTVAGTWSSVPEVSQRTTMYSLTSET